MRQSRAGTWLHGAPLLVVLTLHGEDSVDGTTVSFLLAENLKLKNNEEEEKERRRKKHVTHMRELDRRKKAGERLSAPDDDAWREWKSVSLGLPSRDEQEEEEEAAQILFCSLSSHLDTWTLFLLSRSLVRLSALVFSAALGSTVDTFHAPGFVVLWKLPRSSSSTTVVWLAGFACPHVSPAVFPSIVSWFLRRKVPRSSSTTAVVCSWLVMLV